MATRFIRERVQVDELVSPVDSPRPALRLAALLSTVLAGVAAITCGLMGVLPGVMHETALTRGNAQGTALTILLVALPCVAVSAHEALRGSQRAQLVWLGGLTYILYNSVIFAYGEHFNALFLLYAAMLGLSFWSLVTLLCGIEAHVLWLRFAITTPVRGIAIYLAAVQGLFALTWLKDVLPAILANGRPGGLQGTGMITNPVQMTDFAFSFPLTALIVLWLWRREAWGYVGAGALLVYGVLEAVSIATDQWFGHVQDPLHTAVAVPLFAAMALIGLYPAIVFLRGLAVRRIQPEDRDDLDAMIRELLRRSR
jgi:hypothetical protein